jgi:endoglucanase
MNTELLRRLCETPGIPGREERVRDLIRREIAGLFDDVEVDAMGSMICRRAPRGTGGKPLKPKSEPTRLMLASHMDEIGFYVSHIDDNGFVRLNAAGGFDTRNLFSRRVLVCTKRDGDLLAVMNPGGRPVHIASEEDKKKIPEVKDFFLDMGMPAAKVKKTVTIGDMVVLHEPFITVGDKAVSKAMDNRVACWLGIESVRALDAAKKPHSAEIYVAFTTQEEVGLRGAKTAAAKIRPDIGIGLDVTLACDTPGVPKEEAVSIHGNGAVLHVMDGSIISDYKLIDDLEAIAKKNKIKVQRSILARGGQDGAAIQQTLSGARAAGLTIGTRYIHTVTEMIDLNDLKAGRDLLAAWMPSVS